MKSNPGLKSDFQDKNRLFAYSWKCAKSAAAAEARRSRKMFALPHEWHCKAKNTYLIIDDARTILHKVEAEVGVGHKRALQAIRVLKNAASGKRGLIAKNLGVDVKTVRNWLAGAPALKSIVETQVLHDDDTPWVTFVHALSRCREEAPIPAIAKKQTFRQTRKIGSRNKALEG